MYLIANPTATKRRQSGYLLLQSLRLRFADATQDWRNGETMDAKWGNSETCHISRIRNFHGGQFHWDIIIAKPWATQWRAKYHLRATLLRSMHWEAERVHLTAPPTAITSFTVGVV